MSVPAEVRPPRPWATLNRLAWDVALDRIELDTILVEQMVSSQQRPTLEPWEEPDVHGPIPAELLPRALALQGRQAAAMQALEAALTVTGRQQAFADRVTASSANGLPSPAYVDLTG